MVFWELKIYRLILNGYTILQKKKVSLHIATPNNLLQTSNKKLLRTAVESDFIHTTKESYHANI